MYIKSITLEGFKSYGTKVEIQGFDPEFNAITGLNGSGKSNILDSICFVLGIQNLSQVRANNLTELVYKNGTAGISKATVSIIFDNTDKRLKPPGYAMDEIVVTRTVMVCNKCKYTINGATATSQRIHDLFQSVQMNVNNPHFLIMQGRITKVLNMKPLEILSMIEEAVGTRMYEEKRANCIKNLEKKDSKLREINAMLTEHICPQLDKLRDDRKEFTEYTGIVRRYDQLSKIYTAWDYCRTEEIVKKSVEEKDSLIKKMADYKQLILDLKKQMKESDVKIAEIEKKMDTECGNQLQTLETELKNKQVTETKAETQLRNLRDALNQEKKNHAALLKSVKDEKSILIQKDKELKNSATKLETLKSAADKDTDAITMAENKFHAVNAGLSDADGEEASLAAQLIAARKDKTEAETESKSLEMSIKHIKADLVKREGENKKVDKSYTQDQALYQKLENEVKKLKEEISILKYEEGKYENFVMQEKQFNTEISGYQNKLENLYAEFPQLSFDYVDPVKGFDRKKVHGPVCMQMELKDSRDALAMDIAAAGKLYNIVVNDEQTGKLLLSKGQLKRRCTIIPLNKIQGTVIDNRTLHEAESLVGKTNVSLALDRILYEKNLQPAMEYIYGNVFVCPTMPAAKEVTFAKNIRKRSVTLDGELFDPAGTLSGGSMGNRGRLLADLAPVPKLKRAINEKQTNLKKIRLEIQNIWKLKERYDSLNEQYDLKQNEAELLKSKIQQSTYHNQIEEFQRLQKTLEEQKSALLACTEKQKKAVSLIKELEIKASQTNRETIIKDAERAVAECKKKAAVSLEKFNAFEAEVDGLKWEIEGINEELISLEQQIATSNKNLEESGKKYQEAEEKCQEIKVIVGDLSEEVNKQKGILKSHSSEIHKIGKEKDAMSEQMNNTELQLQQLEHDVKNCGDSGEDAKKKLKYLLDKNKWIEGDKKYFGVQNSEFDFSNFNPSVSGKKLKELEELKEKLKKNVNMKAQNMLNDVEDQFENLMKKKQVVIDDKQVIENVILELDEKKKTILINACKKVNKDFGSIFQTLLPGANAMLEAENKDCVLEGLRIKVGFGDVWKESLNELSGGQRSLVALSLILALLLFNPAPIYILDEVDAALDLSHTQNIGKMLKMHFTKSQFIVVSLKDGMFNNANVLFRTRFCDGMSSVNRTVQRSRN